jgi:hypothetical protein
MVLIPATFAHMHGKNQFPISENPSKKKKKRRFFLEKKLDLETKQKT